MLRRTAEGPALKRLSQSRESCGKRRKREMGEEGTVRERLCLTQPASYIEQAWMRWIDATIDVIPLIVVTVQWDFRCQASPHNNAMTVVPVLAKNTIPHVGQSFETRWRPCPGASACNIAVAIVPLAIKTVLSSC